MNLSKKAGIVVAVLCIIALMTAAASAASTPGPAGQQSTGPGSKQPENGQGSQQQMANTNLNNPVTTQNKAGNGGTTPGQGPWPGTGKWY